MSSQPKILSVVHERRSRDYTIETCPPRIFHTFHDDGRRRSKIRRIWGLMVHRCTQPSDLGWTNYGGRGIRVCPEWLASFDAFYLWAATNGYKRGLQIDRRDNDGPYSPDNCHWVDSFTNARNKRNNRVVTAWGETKALSAWAVDPRCKAEYATVWARLHAGQATELALSTPPSAQGPKHRGRGVHPRTLLLYEKYGRPR